MARGFPKIDLLCVFLLYWTLTPSIQAEKHSLYYVYTALSKPVDLPGIYEFTAMGLLDDTQIDYYNSKEKKTIPKQPWMEKMQENYWEAGTKLRKIKEEWFNASIQILMKRMEQNVSDLHVLQKRVGCEVEQHGDLKSLKGIYEYAYDGENFLSFKESKWVANIGAAIPTKRKWNHDLNLNQYTKDYLENECVDWLNKFRKYGDEELRKTSPPVVHVFAKKNTSDTSKLNLTCLATGFFPKEVILTIRKDDISLPDDDIKSSGIRPNHDGSYQMRKSVEIKEEKAEYHCYVQHKTLNDPTIIKWDGTWKNRPLETDLFYIEVVIGVVLVLAVIAVVLYILQKMEIIDLQRGNIQRCLEDKFRYSGIKGAGLQP